jgi:asparagine synthase (glutamine-hydrolysing)
VCGIFGWLDPSVQHGETRLAAMGRALAHRGPDDHGSHLVPADGLALGHNRLSIIDLSAAGHQPMFGEDRRVALTFNGEIYNFLGLRGQLVGAGHHFISNSDSEVIVHGYEEWGESVLDRLHGMFALALWDDRDKTLLLARDPMGIKPLYYWPTGRGGLYFASEIKAFLTLPEFRPAVNLHTLRQYLQTNFIYDAQESSLEGVFKVPPGHVARVQAADLKGHGALRSRAFFEPPSAARWTGDEPDIDARADRLYDTLSTVVGQHLIADVPVGLLLSGGLDSSLVAALASRHQPVRTISMAFADSAVDERPFARLVSQHLGTHHEEVVIRPEEVAADLESAVWFVDDLFGDWGVISTRVLYQRCRDAGVKVVLVGEGSDELFGGYVQHAWSAGLEKGGSSLLGRALRLYQGYSGRRWGSGLPEFLRTLNKAYVDADSDPFSALRLFECRHQLPHCYNMKVDRASMAASVEARVPFLDVRVAREAFSTPQELLLRDGKNKYLLRRMAERHALLPTEIVNRPKYGASMAASWMDAVPGFRSFAREIVLDPSGWAEPLGLRTAMEEYFDKNRRGYSFPRSLSIFSVLAWRLLLLNLWSRRYLPCPAKAA